MDKLNRRAKRRAQGRRKSPNSRKDAFTRSPLARQILQAIRDTPPGQLASIIQQQVQPPQQSLIQQPAVAVDPSNQSVRPLSQIIIDALLGIAVEVYKHVWNETDPNSYKLYQATFAVAPYWPRAQDWALNVTALGSAAYGFVCIKERVERILEQDKRR